MNRAFELLRDSKRPLMLIGAGARDSIQDILAFAHRWKIPMETTWNAVDLVPHNDYLFVGRPGIVATRGSNKAVQECDLLLSIGARLDQPTIAYDYYKFAPKAKKVLVDIDMSESLKIPNLDMFIHQDAGEFIRDLNSSPIGVSPDEWTEKCLQWKQDRLEGNSATNRLMDELSDTLPSDAIIVMNCGCMAVNIFCAGFRNKEGQRFIMSSCGLGSMGAAISVAIGAALASDKPVTVIDGDGSFMMNIQELEVVRRLNLPITFYVINNGGYASIRSSELRTFGRSRGGETIPNLVKVSRAFGVEIHELMAEHDEFPIPRVMFDGRGDLGDMYPYD